MYRQDVSSFALEVWWQSMQGFDIEQVRKAFTAHAMDPDRGQFAPKPADLIRVLQGTRGDRSLVAWGKLLDAMQRVGAYTTVCFDDGLIHLAVEDCGGWIKCCRGLTDELPFLQKRFCDAYKAYSSMPDVKYPPKLYGEHEITNARLPNYKDPAPTLIGDAGKAINVLQNGSNRRLEFTSADDFLRNQPRLPE
jgi:hypothetical protein